ncbi:uncharacterized protein LOC135401565 [Ornithodoros turicata]|uniref:uncharacterized protein LOC135401565 n=1 Tax=Ornithodoros turicata TaxID=34597 RepID=UPI0031398618
MKVFYVLAILLLVIYTVPAQENGSNGKQYTLGVYILCDEPMTKHLEGHNVEEYFGAFFNVINLAFRQLASPKVTFEVVTVDTTSSLDDLKTAYKAARLDGNRYLYGLWPEHISVTNGQIADGTTTTQLSEYFKKAGEPYNNSHVIVLFTRRTVALHQVAHDDALSKGLAVHANPKRGGICGADNIVIVQDDGVFSGIASTIRRLARLLGANYDYAKEPNCLYSSSMLMGDISQTRNYKMSPCTLQNLTASLGEASKQGCLVKKFESKVASTTKLPADLTNPDNYCAHIFPGKENIAQCTQEKWSLSLYPSAETCEVLCCHGLIDSWKRNLFKMEGVGSLDGYPCDASGHTNGICVNGACEARPT